MGPNLARISTVPPDAQTSPCHSPDATPGSGSALTTQVSAEDRDGHSDDDDDDHDRTTTINNNDASQDPDALRLQRTHTTPSPYRLLPQWRKNLVVFVTAFTALPITFGSTSLFPLTQEISTSLNSTPAHIQLINAIVLVLMGCSIFFWGPLSKIFGRKNAWLAATVIFAVTTAGTAFGGIGLAVFTAMRVISGFEGTFFHIAGQTWIADIFEPTERGTATGFFLVGTVFGPAFGPCFAGIMVTYTTWRSVLWLQVAMSGIGLILSGTLPTEKITKKQQDDDEDKDKLTPLAVLKLFDPTNTFKAFLFPNILLTDIACGCMSWSQYTLLAAPRHVLNPRFNLTTPLVSGLFYIAPGVGFILGTLIGGRYSDATVRKHIALRGGLRLPQDRLLSGRVAFFAIIPLAQLVYGWCLHFNVPQGTTGGLAVALVFAAVQAFGLLFAFASLNTYCAEALPRRRSEVIASKYLVQYGTSAVGSAVVVPLIDAVGMGPATTISALLVLVAGCLSMITAKYGINMQRWAERKMPQLLAL
ncbi:major facilitator superfamily domain-containing protein [Microdochium trichocladiopsis]|uniref:Major facilitator superfamily domain-containing protein n=1 Tax=Microdochium trichocladiopsis TaxID=1682393 RepID=A0A9P8Y6R8_9PEZI|nr:major facilitator superfamily domain-containing protein [Microdochium trichocladiopsis]KAH7029107.1 major facilitator superfamily domain-containing protein [Microdochium trichocladiopsis]